jgi:hypothetical protein
MNHMTYVAPMEMDSKEAVVNKEAAVDVGTMLGATLVERDFWPYSSMFLDLPDPDEEIKFRLVLEFESVEEWMEHTREWARAKLRLGREDVIENTIASLPGGRRKRRRGVLRAMLNGLAAAVMVIGPFKA